MNWQEIEIDLKRRMDETAREIKEKEKELMQMWEYLSEVRYQIIKNEKQEEEK